MPVIIALVTLNVLNPGRLLSTRNATPDHDADLRLSNEKEDPSMHQVSNSTYVSPAGGLK